MLARFRKLSLTAKLLLIGIVPTFLMIYFSFMLYREKEINVGLLGNYIEHVEQSQNVGELIAELSRERRSSYLYTIKDTGYKQILEHRHQTDSILSLLKNSPELSLRDFPKYTFLDSISFVRGEIDSLKYSPDAIMQYYTDVISRINMTVTSIPRNIFLKTVYQDLVAQKKLAEMITYLSIIRTDIFNVLLTQKSSEETLLRTLGQYKLYKSYETEFLLKASPGSVKLYNDRKNAVYLPMSRYIDKLFRTMKFDSTYNPDEWWQVSTLSLSTLRKQQRDLWEKVDTAMKQLYQAEIASRNQYIFLMVFSILLVIAFVIFMVTHINNLLGEIKLAAFKISLGASHLQLKNMPRGIIGSLADSIIDIDKNNRKLAYAANQIGKGNFAVKVKPRSEEDLLGISILKMKQDLHEFTSQKDRIQKETEDLNYRRDEFFSIASHELKTPVTSLKAYTQLMLMDAEQLPGRQHKNMLERMDTQINKLTSLINDVLDTTRLENEQLVYHKETFILSDLVSEMIAEIQLTASDHEIIFNNHASVCIYADRERIRQVMRNLLSNAVKYAAGSDKIIVTLTQKMDHVIYSVQDFGNGIDAEEHSRIFQRFYRISGKNLNTYPGLGLGLYICKEVIEKHNGRIGLESARGKGSTFYFELPIA